MFVEKLSDFLSVGNVSVGGKGHLNMTHQISLMQKSSGDEQFSHTRTKLQCYLCGSSFFLMTKCKIKVNLSNG